MPDKTISEATNKTTLEAADMLPLAVPNDDQAYHITGQNLFNSIPEGSTAVRGTVEIATDSEAAAGISVSKVVVPSGLLIRKTSNAILAGDLGGDARGVGSLDVQSDRSSSSQVASGEGAVAVGISEKAEGAGSVAVGISNNATGTNSVALGYNVDATQPSAVSLGKDCTASADSAVAAGMGAVASAAGSLALGKNAAARVPKTTNIAGPLITRKDNNETADLAFETYSAGIVTLMTKEIDLKAVAMQTLTLPADCHFYPQRVGIICTMKSALSARPRIHFGVVGDNQRLRSSTDALVDDKWQSYFWDVSPTTTGVDGTTTLTAGVSQAAVATTMRGRLWIQGLLVEDE